MKKYLESFMLLFIGLVVFAACNDDDDKEYHWATATGEQVYFSKDLPSVVNISESETTFTVPINRVNTATALKVDLHVADSTEKLQIPTSVTFAAGESVQNIVVTYNSDDFEYADYKDVVISIIDETLTTPYGASSYSFSVGKSEPFVSLGKGTLSDDFLGGTATVEIMQNQNQPNVFRIVNPYDGITNDGDYQGDANLDITIIPVGATLAGETITEENTVYFTTTNTGYFHPTYEAWIKIYHPAEGFKATPTADTWVKNKVLAYQEDGKTPGQIQLAPFYYMDGVGGWNQTQNDGMIVITFPGYSPKDYSIEAAYTGKFVNTSEEAFANITLTLGSDLESVKYALVAGNDAEAAISGIIDGTIESQVANASGDYRLPVKESGRYTVAVVGYAENNVVSSTSVSFKIELGAPIPENWNPIYVGTYTYGVQNLATQGELFYEGESEVVLYESDLDDSRLKVLPWGETGNEGGLVFTLDEAGNIVVDEVETGYVDEEWGMVYATDVKTYGAADLASTYSNGKFTFYLAYHDYDGAWAYQQDELVLTGNAASRIADIVAKKAMKKAQKHEKLAKWARPIQKNLK
ncbi:MAG: hypothetical protein IJV34_02930 [Prevotella sp.]|nr:hypothetical protein [Prevotella sp.]